MDAALAIWRSSTLAVGSLVETYFVSRGLLVSPPPTIRRISMVGGLGNALCIDLIVSRPRMRSPDWGISIT